MVNKSTKNHETYTVGRQKSAVIVMAGRSARTHAGFLLPHLRKGMSVLDVGCGPGTITLGLAEAVAPGQVVGVDIAESQVAIAAANAKQHRTANAQFRVASAYELPFENDCFDAVFSHAVIEHLREPEKAVAEMFRVLRPGGVAGLRGVARKADMWRPDDGVIGDVIDLYFRVWRLNGGNPEIGLEQPRLLREAGFSDVHVSAGVEDISGSVENIAKWILQPDFVQTVKAQRWGDERSLQRQHDGMVEWSLKPGAFWLIVWGEATARKPGGTAP